MFNLAGNTAKEKASDLVGQVLWGANNIFAVACEDGRERKCRLRGKILDHEGQEHNPLICGDLVLVEDINHENGMIYFRLERRNVLRRRNLKKGEPQTFAANIDGIILMLSWSAPPLRSAFLDRLLVAAFQADCRVVVILNKIDYIKSISELWGLHRFLRLYRQLGLEVWPVSLLDHKVQKEGKKEGKEHIGSAGSLVAPVSMAGPSEGFMRFKAKIGALVRWSSLEQTLVQGLLRLFYQRTKYLHQRLYQSLADKLYTILGSSGVGKSSLCNYFFPEQFQEIREISRKWQRGVHTTTLARTLTRIVETPASPSVKKTYRLIDTPGMRNFLPELAQEELPCLQNYFPEFSSLRKICAYSLCLHRGEPDCAVRDAANYQLISPQRYQSYLNLYSDLENSLNEMPGYQTQGKSEGRKRKSHHQNHLKERKKKRSKLELQLTEEGTYDSDDYS